LSISALTSDIIKDRREKIVVRKEEAKKILFFYIDLDTITDSLDKLNRTSKT